MYYFFIWPMAPQKFYLGQLLQKMEQVFTRLENFLKLYFFEFCDILKLLIFEIRKKKGKKLLVKKTNNNKNFFLYKLGSVNDLWYQFVSQKEFRSLSPTLLICNIIILCNNLKFRNRKKIIFAKRIFRLSKIY